MNDTTRDELREQVTDGLMDAIGLDAWGSDNTFILHAHDLYPAVDKVVEIVTAARDAEIREILLTHADGYIVAKGQDREAAFATKPWMEQILNAIGLHGDEAGGQG